MGDAVDAVIDEVMRRGRAGDIDGAWAALRPYERDRDRDARVAWAWLLLIKNGTNPHARLDEVESIAAAWSEDPHIANLAAETLYRMVDGRAADENVPENDPSMAAAEVARLALAKLEASDDPQLRDPALGGALWWTLANALRLAGPAHDDEALAAYQRALEIQPHEAWLWFDLGLWHKFRHHWEEGVRCFRRVLAAEPGDDAGLNNLAVCCTAVGLSEEAVRAWRKLGFGAELGDDELPQVKRLPPVMVRLPVQASPGGDPPPVEFEHVWVEPHSPCHGAILSPPMYSSAASYSDLVLFDRAPVGWTVRNGNKTPRFPFLQLVRRGSAVTLPFAGPAEVGAELEALGHELPCGARFYRFDVNVALRCAECIRTGESHRSDHSSQALRTLRGPVRGALLCESQVNLETVRELLDARLGALRLAIPELYLRLGDEVGAARARRLRAELD